MSEYPEFVKGDEPGKPFPETKHYSEIFSGAKQPLKPKSSTFEEHTHIWDIIDIWRPNEQPYHPQLTPREVTIVLLICKVCNFPKTEELRGKWTLQKLRKAQVANEGE